MKRKSPLRFRTSDAPVPPDRAAALFALILRRLQKIQSPK